jgi:hypothetical protein
MRVSAMPLLLLLGAVPACGDIDIVSVRTGNAIPLAMQGEWSGSWTSSSSAANGTVGLRLQSYAGEAVVGVTIDNPCVVPRSYQLLVTGTSMQLWADGAVVFTAVLASDGTMAGTYQCEADAGIWQATWQRDLPPIEDISGVWEGTVVSASSELPLLLVLEQSVRGGAVVVDGALLMPGVLPGSLGVTGSLRFREGFFDFVLGTTSGVVPMMQMAGIGDSPSMAIRDGLLQASPSPLLPFQNAVWQAAWKSR